MPSLEPITVTAERIEIDDAQTRAAKAAGASEADLSLIQRFKSRARDFQLARDELQRMGAAVAKTNDYDLLMEYSRLVDRGNTIAATIEKATRAIDDAIAFARGALGDLTHERLGSLGVVWLLPSAVLLGAIAVVGYWLADYMKFAKRFNEQARIAAELERQGMDPAQAQVEAGRAVGATAPTFFGQLGNAATLVAIAVVGFVLFRNWRG